MHNDFLVQIAALFLVFIREILIPGLLPLTAFNTDGCCCITFRLPGIERATEGDNATKRGLVLLSFGFSKFRDIFLF